MKYTAFCGEKVEIVHHVSKCLVSIFVDQIYEIWLLGFSNICILYLGWVVAKS
jgi:hypothetical protein